MTLKTRTMLSAVFAFALLQFAIHANESNLPKVLVIGDSISMGYIGTVKKELNGKADVSRPRGNCGPSDRGVKNIGKWLGTTKWDIIHFNFGIWDAHMLSKGKLIPFSKFATTKDKKRSTN